MGTPSDHYDLENVGALASAYGGNDGPVEFDRQNGNGESRKGHFNAGSMGQAQNQKRPPRTPPAESATPSRLAAYAAGAAFKIGK